MSIVTRSILQFDRQVGELFYGIYWTDMVVLSLRLSAVL